MENALVSIALCTYNGEKYLIEQLDTLVNQSYTNLEIIAVDDCSTDGTVAILKQYEAKHTNFRVYQNDRNLGYIKNFEKAISLCQGDFIALSDQDDVWDLHKVETQLAKIGSSVLTYHNSAFIDSNGMPMNKSMSDVINMYEGSSYRPFLLYNCISGHTILFQRKYARDFMPFPKDIFHDRWMGFVATNLGSINYVDECLVKYRQHDNSDTNILKIKRDNNRPAIIGREKILKAVSDLEVFSRYPKIKDEKFINRFYDIYKEQLNSYVSIGLVSFLFFHYKSLLFIYKKGALSKLNFIYKHVWGAKIKNN